MADAYIDQSTNKGQNGVYTIEAYDGNIQAIRTEEFKQDES